MPGPVGKRKTGRVETEIRNPESAIRNTVAPKLHFPTTRDLPAHWLHRILDSLLNLVYPDECFICALPIAHHKDCGICNACWTKAVALQIMPPRCSSCGLPFQSFQQDSGHLCGNCILETPAYSGARSFGHYTAELSSLIQEFKFRGRRNLDGLLAPLLAGTFFENWDRQDFDLIVPVPLHPKRKRQRGYNQSELLARSLARLIAIPCQQLLVRIRSTLPQVGLTDSRRKENVRNAFRCRNPESILKMRLLLIDDVMTTGATVASAARTLMDGGALRVSVLTVARAEKW
jgi:competence protein ComFC